MRTLRVARDDNRVAVLAGREGERRLWVGRVAARPDGSRLAVLARNGEGRYVPYLLADDGYQPTPVTEAGLPAAPTGEEIAAAPDQPVAMTCAGQVWLLEGSRWRSVGSGADRLYPG